MVQNHPCICIFTTIIHLIKMRHLIILLVLFNFITGSKIQAQEKPAGDSSTRYIQLNEVVISANKFAENKRNVVQKVDVISQQYIARVNAQNTGDLLSGTGNVFVQKSQQGGSSPVVRGFEASRVLLVVDGIRMNNAIYRAGHLQNVITVDQNSLERVEVMYGPSSTLYGSDALGGTIHMVTKPVKLSEGPSPLVTGSMFSRYSTVNEEKTGHFDINLGYRKIGFLTSINYSDFGDMKMGSRYPSDYPDFGRRSFYVTRPGGAFIDSIVKNDDDRVQKFSGYKQWDLMQKILFQQSDKISHLVNIQLSNSSNVPRYDRLQDVRNGNLRYAEWFYGPQKRNLFAYTLAAERLNGLFNAVKFTASYQDIEESRQQRDYKRYDRFDSRREKIKVAGFVLDLWKKWGQNELTAGIDAQFNALTSEADRTNLLTGAKSKLDSRYPNGDNNMNSFAVFGQHIYKFGNGKWVLNDGIRFQQSVLKSTIADNSFFNLPYTSIKQNPFAVTGNLGLVYHPDVATKWNIGFSSGFRAPNIDDLARIFESSTSLQRVVVPNPDIKPEYTYNFETGISHIISQKIKIEGNVFYTLFRNAIALAPFQLNGQDSINYNGTQSQVIANQNVNKAYLYGFSATVSGDITSHFSFLTTLSFTKGRYKTESSKLTGIYEKQPDGSYALVQKNVSEKPLDHIPPVFGKTSFIYRSKIFNAEFFALYNGWKKLDNYNPDGEDNAQYATADGMPSWVTFNIRTSVNVNRQIVLQFAVENLLDRNYRYFASGFSAPGRNFMGAVKVNF